MELTIMETKRKNLGVCETCNHIEDCLHRFSNGMVIWFCEQFDDYVSPKPLSIPKISTTSLNPGKVEGYLWLCVNCEHRTNCKHSKTPSGIWHCEEYS